MSVERQIPARATSTAAALPAIKDVVVGLHWDPPPEGARVAADLDIFCVLFDAHDKVLEVVHTGHPRGVNDCIVHTGDSRNGASVWDDERVFVFTQALPQTVAKFAFAVLSADRQPFDAIPGAYCHVSDHASEEEHLRIDLTALTGRTELTAAILTRSEGGWSLAADVDMLQGELLAELRRLIRGK